MKQEYEEGPEALKKFEDGMYVWDGEEESPIRWRPSIHMPRWASRITLEITDVRVQRLNEISDADAIAEGIEGDGNGHYANHLDRADDARIGMWMGTKSSYASLWEYIHAKKHPWYSNPWVWVIEFTREPLDRRLVSEGVV